MTLPSTLFLVLLSAILVFGGLHPTHQKGEPMEGRKARTWLPDRQKRSVGSQGNSECQEGNPLGAGYSGKINLTASGRSCQAWSQHKNLISTNLLIWESTTIAGTQIRIVEASGATPQIMIRSGSTALFKSVSQNCQRFLTSRPTTTMSLTATVSTLVQPWKLVLSRSPSPFALR